MTGSCKWETSNVLRNTLKKLLTTYIMVLSEPLIKRLLFLTIKEGKYPYKSRHPFLAVWTGNCSKGLPYAVIILLKPGTTTGTGMDGTMAQQNWAIMVPMNWM